MLLVVLLLGFSALCWALLLLSWKGRLTRASEDARMLDRQSAEVLDLQRERWRRRRNRPFRNASSSR